MNKFDVIIVGAGSGRLNCAKFLGNSGLKVLLVKKIEPRTGMSWLVKGR